jgi:hypothetical protein
VVGGIYSPTHQSDHWGWLLSTGAPDSPVRNRTLSGAPATSPNRWGSQVGASDNWATGQSGGALDRYCHCPVCLLAPALTLRTQSAYYSVVSRPLNSTVALATVAPLGTPDSPVNYSGVALQKPEAEQFGVDLPGAPDTVRWHTGQSGAPDQGSLRFSFAPFF